MESTGVPFLKVMACHSELGGTPMDEEGEHQVAGFARTPATQMSDGETYDIKHFTVKIVQKGDEIYDMAQVNVRVVAQKEDTSIHVRQILICRVILLPHNLFRSVK